MTDDDIISVIISDKSIKALTNTEPTNLNRILIQLESNGFINLHGSAYCEPYQKSISLTRLGANFLYLNKTYSEHMSEKKPCTKTIFNIGTLTANGSAFGNNNSNINISDHNVDGVIEALNNAIESIKHNQDMELIFKGKLVDTYTELLSVIQTSKESKLPLFDNLLSIATSMISLI